MCATCGCQAADPASAGTDHAALAPEARLLAANARAAAHVREHLTGEAVLSVNLMGSPGAGKTALLEATAPRLAGLRAAALSGDLATDRDARRLARAGLPARAITTGQACHLDARMVHEALHGAPFGAIDLLFVENVGNLVCPAAFDLGEAARVVCLSVTEGEDKPEKYPPIFARADLVVLTKCDLLPYLEYDLGVLQEALGRVMPEPRLLRASARTGEGLDAWCAWLLERRRAVLGPLAGVTPRSSAAAAGGRDSPAGR